MPHKKKKLFTKANSTKYVLITDGRDENGEKIQQNTLVPVSGNMASASAMLFSNLANVCSAPNGSSSEDEETKEVSKPSRRVIESARDKDVNLDKILNDMEDSSDSDDEEFDMLKSKMKNLGFFDEPNRTANRRSNVQIEILDEEDFSDEFGQFSDAESDSDFDSQSVKRKPTLTSAKVDCPENLKILNEGFEKVLGEYTDDQIGGLDDEEICGTFTTENELLQHYITPFKRDEEEVVIGECDENIKKKILLLMEVEQPEPIVHIKTEKPLEFDCESIISTYSNKYNHPVLIKEESKIRKINIPANPLKGGLTKSQLKTLESESESDESEDDDVSVATSFNIRIKGETQEQRRERKALFKEAKRESRKLKKENKLAFKHEKKLQTSHAINTRFNMGMKLV